MQITDNYTDFTEPRIFMPSKSNRAATEGRRPNRGAPPAGRVWERPIFKNFVYLCLMDRITSIPTVKDYDRYWGVPSRHPYVNILEGSRIETPIPNCRKNIGTYVIFLKDVQCADYITYGRQEYDYQENTLVFIAPGRSSAIPPTAPHTGQRDGAYISVRSCFEAHPSPAA